ncbi:hypothetical protein H0H92_012393 [Tricholoma furcatifolium]|nr:hypothetical protein H0H92_012393 [Tricholoma furcatifolium]
MNIVSDWVVTFGDGTRDLRFKLPNTDDDSDNSDNASISSSTENDYSPRRKHVRTIFAEVCQTIFEVRDVRSMILTLQGVTKALWYMWKAGYVHRDVSAGNCLWNGEVGKLSDLEYAKKYDTLKIHDPVTGTEIFTAVEVTFGQYRNLPMPPAVERPQLDFGANTLEEMRLQVLQSAHLQELMQEPPDMEPLVVPTFRFNFYHDLESVFWILAWFLHHRFPKAEWLHTNFPHHKYDAAFVESQLRASLQKSIYPVIGRQALFDPRVVVGIHQMRSMFKAIYPKALHSLPNLGLNLIRGFQLTYQELESEEPQKHSSDGHYYWAHQQFRGSVYWFLQHRFEWILLDIQQLGDIPVQSVFTQ